MKKITGLNLFGLSLFDLRWCRSVVVMSSFSLLLVFNGATLASEVSRGQPPRAAHTAQTSQQTSNISDGQLVSSRPSSDIDYSMVVDQRLYDGGMDEESLQVQKKLPLPYTTIDLQSVRGDVLEQVIEEKENEEEMADAEASEEEADPDSDISSEEVSVDGDEGF